MQNRFSLIYDPVTTWQKLADKNYSVSQIYIRMLLVMAAIPPISAFIGSSYIGWRIGFEEPVKLTVESAAVLCIAFYAAILVGMYIFARLVTWMAQTYDAKPSVDKSLALVSYSCTPLFLISIVSVYPLLWLDLLFTLVAMALCIRLIFVGTPIVMKIEPEKAFLFANSILTVAMVLVVGLLATTVLFWGHGFGPQYTS